MSEGEEGNFADFEAQANDTEAAEIVVEDKKPVEEPVEAAEEGAEVDQDDDSGDDEVAEVEEKPKNRPSDRIRELNGKLRAEQREKAALVERLEAIESRLTENKVNDTPSATGTAPDPNDLELYPLGSLDDRYIEDMIEHVANRKVAETLESARQREAEKAQQAEAERQQAELIQKAETVASRGAELFDDFEEKVVIPAMQGKFDLTQTTFEALAEAEHGAEILHSLASNAKEASRVASLSVYQQAKYVMEKDAEFAGGSKAPARKLPAAGAPPQSNIRGSGNRSSFDPATADFAQFERKANAAR
jgi:hypothetical protein